MLKGLVASLGVDGLFLKNWEDSHRLFKQLNTSSQVHSKVHRDPLNALSHVFLLLKHKHVVVEELLQLFIDKVNAKLFKCVELKDLKPSNIQHTDEVNFLHGGVHKSCVTHVYKVSEETTKAILDDGSGADHYRVHILGLVHPFCANLKDYSFNNIIKCDLGYKKNINILKFL